MLQIWNYTDPFAVDMYLLYMCVCVYTKTQWPFLDVQSKGRRFI